MSGPLCSDHAEFDVSLFNAPSGVGTISFPDGNPGIFTDNADGSVTVSPSSLMTGMEGVYTILYTIASDESVETGCAAYTIEHEVAIYELFEATFSLVSEMCIDDADAMLSVAGITDASNIVWTISPSSASAHLTSNADGSADFDPTGAGAGTYEICATVGSDAGCLDSYCSSVTVAPAVDAVIEASYDACFSPSGSFDLTGLFTGTTTTGGTFVLTGGTGTGVVSGDVLFYNGTGDFTIEYTVSSYSGANVSCNASSTSTVNILASPSFSFDLPDESVSYTHLRAHETS